MKLLSCLFLTNLFFVGWYCHKSDFCNVLTFCLSLYSVRCRSKLKPSVKCSQLPSTVFWPRTNPEARLSCEARPLTEGQSGTKGWSLNNVYSLSRRHPFFTLNWGHFCSSSCCGQICSKIGTLVQPLQGAVFTSVTYVISSAPDITIPIIQRQSLSPI